MMTLDQAIGILNHRMQEAGYELCSTSGNWDKRVSDRVVLPGKVSTWMSDQGQAKVVIYSDGSDWNFVIYKEAARGRVEPLKPFPPAELSNLGTSQISPEPETSVSVTHA